jgi:hypothetical protein
MFHIPTVFVIGAGAGCDVDMPLGKQLAREIADRVDFRFKDGLLARGNERLHNDLLQLAGAKGVNRRLLWSAGNAIAGGIGYVSSVDTFVDTHDADENIKDVAKTAISQIIVEREKASPLWIDEANGSHKFRDRTRVQDQTWLSGFVQILRDEVSKGDLEIVFNNLTIVNFNYDRCLEHFLFIALRDLFLLTDDEAKSLCTGGKLKIFHPYGSLGPLPWQSGEDAVGFGGGPFGQYDTVKMASGIRTFSEQMENTDHLVGMHDAILRAQQVVFLGFGFHGPNMELLTPDGKQEGPQSVPVYSTTVDLSASDLSIYQSRVIAMLGGRTGHSVMKFDADFDCIKLIKDYGKRLSFG